MPLTGSDLEKIWQKTKRGNFEQAGLTKVGNTLVNVFIMRECIEEIYRKKNRWWKHQ